MKKILFLLFLFVSTLCSGQDLVVSGVSGPTSFGANDIFTGSITLKNNGIVDITDATSYVHLFLSPDNIYDNSDLKVGYTFTQSLKAGETQTPYYTFGDQILLPPGAYYLIAVADKDNYVQETDDNNNTLVIPGYTITAGNFDFKVASFSVGNELFISDTFSPQFQLVNPGRYSAFDRLFTNFYLSKDQVIDDTDLLCGELSNWLNYPLDNSSATPWIDALTVRAYEPGQYYMIAKVDPNNDFVETDENNNTFVYGVVNVNPSDIDLQTLSLFVSEPNGSGSFSVNASVDLFNNGTTGFNLSFGYGYYGQASAYVSAVLSTDQFYDSNDLSLQTNNYGNFTTYIGPMQGAGMPLDLSTPYYNQVVPPGTYYVILTVSAFSDTNYSNNTVVSNNTITVGAPVPQSISMTSANFTGSYSNIDNYFSLSTQFKNNGTATFSDAIHYNVTVRDASNTVVSSSLLSQYISVDAGQSTSGYASFGLSSPLPYGSYTIDFTCVDSNKCNSDSFSLPLAVDKYFHSLSGKIQGEDGAPITNGKLFLYQKDNSGNVKFIQKITPITGQDFTFSIDNHQHTLYFIPDAVGYPQYVPTIFRKTVTLGPNNFFKISNDTTVTFEILKVQPLPLGTQTISGNVYTSSSSSSSGRMATAPVILKNYVSATPLTVLLLNTQGNVVAITTTDINGYYEFTNLPAGNYELLVPFELNHPSLMKTPVPVDVTTESKDISFDFSSGAPVTTVKTLQSITFDALGVVTYAHEPIPLSASSSSGLPLIYASSDLSVATISNDQVTIVGVGTATITASQPGSDIYKGADATQFFEVTKAPLKINAENKSRSYGEANPPLTFVYDGFKAGENIGTSGVTPPSITTLATPNSNAGTYSIEFTGGDGGSHYTLDFTTATLTINKADQSITFNSELPDINSNSPAITLLAQSSSGLPVTFNVIEGADVVTQNGAILTLTGKDGTVTVQALQSGDNNYNAALPLNKTFKVNLVLGIEPGASDLITVNPNPTSGELFVKSGATIKRLSVWNLLGQKINSMEELNDKELPLNLSGFAQGTYLLDILLEDGQKINKRIVVSR